MLWWSLMVNESRSFERQFCVLVCYMVWSVTCSDLLHRILYEATAFDARRTFFDIFIGSAIKCIEARSLFHTRVLTSGRFSHAVVWCSVILSLFFEPNANSIISCTILLICLEVAVTVAQNVVRVVYFQRNLELAKRVCFEYVSTMDGSILTRVHKKI